MASAKRSRKATKRKHPRHLHAHIRAAAEGHLPDWAVAGRARRAHVERVTELMDRWASELALTKTDRMRWRAAGMLHDALRDEPGAKLRPLVQVRFRHLPDRVLHGPAAARRLKREGVEDRDLLRAVRFHTLGHQKLDRLGRALCVADFVEPGRRRQRRWRDELLERMPDDVDDVVRDIFKGRIRLLAQRGDELTPWTVGFWNALVASRRR